MSSRRVRHALLVWLTVCAPQELLAAPLPSASAGSVSGVAQALLQMRNSDVDGLVSLDSGTGYDYGAKLLAQHPFAEPARRTVPYLQLEGRASNRFNVPRDRGFFESARGEAWLVEIGPLRHAQFTSFGALLDLTLGSGHTRELEEGHRTMALYTRRFLDAFVRGDRDARELFDRDPEENGVRRGLATITRRAAPPSSPSPSPPRS
jgi:hypothetical protein